MSVNAGKRHFLRVLSMPVFTGKYRWQIPPVNATGQPCFEFQRTAQEMAIHISLWHQKEPAPISALMLMDIRGRCGNLSEMNTQVGQTVVNPGKNRHIRITLHHSNIIIVVTVRFVVFKMTPVYKYWLLLYQIF